MATVKGKKDEISAVTADELRSQLVIKKMVGKGGFAAVFLGAYKGQEVAVKVILAEHVSPESLQVKLLLREGQYMSRCTHKNIVKCHAVCQLPADFPGIEALGHRSSTWALVLEYIGGGSLAALIMKQMSQTRKAYSDFEAWCWIRSVAEALSYLHNAPRPVMHRDVKADNVLLTEDEEGRPIAKLMDFGLMAALDGKNPLLRRRSVSANPGGDGLGRTSAASIARASLGAAGGRSLAAPSVATYYNDASHEPGKIFYLMEELPAPTVAALAGPAASRRVSMELVSRGAATAGGGNAAVGTVTISTTSSGAAFPLGAGVPGTPGGGAASPNTQFGFAVVASRGSSFDGGAAAGGGGGAVTVATAATAAAAGVPWGPKTPRVIGGGLGSAAAGSFGTLVPLSEEASFHGNTAGYAAMLMQQQEARRQQAAARRASAEAAAAATAAAAGGGGLAVRPSSAASSLPNSQHGTTQAGSLTGASPPANQSPLPGLSPSPSTLWQGEGVAAGSVRLRMLSDEQGAADAVTGDAAIAMAAARLNRQVSETNGSLVRMSAQRPATPPTGPVLLEDEFSANDGDGPGVTFRETTAGGAPDTPGGAQQPQQQQRASRPNSALKLPPIIAVAKHPLTASVAGDEPPSVAGSPGSALQNPTQPPSMLGGGHGNGNGNGNGSAVPLVGVDSGVHMAGSNPVEGSNPASRRSSRSKLPVVGGGGGVATAAAAAAQLQGGVHVQVTSPPVVMSSSAPTGDNTGGPGSMAQVVRQCSQKSIGSNRSGTGNGYVASTEGGGGAPAAAAAGGGVGALGAGGGQFSIATMLQGRYEQDFQWVWRLTGQTGSCMYMAPEVFRNMPYNEKVDVFSFGVLMYEVLSRTLMLVSALNLRELRLKGMDTPEGYAQTVAEGYRPPKPNAMPEPVFELISACWADDPCARPNMADVVETLRLLQEQYAPQPTSGAVAPCGCVIS